MYILFINSSSKCDIFFSAQFNNNNNNKNCPTLGFNPTHVGWVGLGWVEFFLTHHDGLGQKIPSTRPMHTSSARERETNQQSFGDVGGVLLVGNLCKREMQEEG